MSSHASQSLGFCIPKSDSSFENISFLMPPGPACVLEVFSIAVVEAWGGGCHGSLGGG